MGRMQPFVTVRDFPALADCYAELNGRLLPGADVVLRWLALIEQMKMKSFLAVVCMLCLAGCYTPNDQRFSAYIHAVVKPEASLDAAVAALHRDGFVCDAMRPTPSKTCSRRRQLPLLAACMERANLYATESRAIQRVDVPKIACTGL
jgi:hypothetical protein